MNKEELKNKIITLLKDVFSFGFYYDEETNKFISEDDYDDGFDYTDIYVDKEGIILGLDINQGWSGYITFDKMAELNKLIKEYYK